jgi:hypothetical protein
MSLAQAADAESLRASSEQSGLPFQAGAARVYLVASVSGGSGSGMSQDVGAAVRTLLEKAGMAEAEIIGVFLHCTGHDPRHCDLARVNTYSWLTEYNHFHRDGGQFCGDESCGLPPLAPGKRPFDAAYLINLGSELDAAQLETATQSVAEYVFLDALTPAHAFFARCRAESSPAHDGSAPLRTFTVQKITAVADVSVENAAAVLAREVALRWVGAADERDGPASTGDTNQLVQGAAKLVGQLQLKLEGIASNSRNLIEGQFGGDQQAFMDSLLELARHEGNEPGVAQMVHMINCLFAAPKEGADGACVLQRPLEAIVSPLTMKLAGDLGRWVLHKLDERQARLTGAQRAADWLIDHITRVEADASRLAGALAKQIEASADELTRDLSGVLLTEDDWQRVAVYFRMRTDEHAVLATALIARRLLAELKSVGATITEFGRHLKNVALSVPKPEHPLPASDPILKAVVENVSALLETIDQQLQDTFITPNGGLFQTIMGNSRVRSQMLQELARLARLATEQVAARPDVRNTILASALNEVAATPGDARQPEAGALLDHGGTYRCLAVIPRNVGDVSRTIASLGPDASTIAGIGYDIILCQESWDLPLVPVAVDLIQRRRDYTEFAARVATRSDIIWTPLTAPSAAAPVACENAFAAVMPTTTQVI